MINIFAFICIACSLLSIANSKSYPIYKPGICSDDWSDKPTEIWGDEQCYSPNYCHIGATQSPASISSWVTDTDLPRLSFSEYGPMKEMEVTNTGHLIQATYTNGSFTDETPGRNFQAAFFQLETYAQEHVKGIGDLGAIYIYHFQYPPPSPSTVAISVICFLIKIGEENSLLQPIIDVLPLIQKPSSSVTLDFPGFSGFIKTLNPTISDGYLNFPGSLNYPPCSEPVDWSIMETQITISSQQWLTLNNFLAKKPTPGSMGNSSVRPIQRNLINVEYRPIGDMSACNSSFCLRISSNNNNNDINISDYGISGVGIAFTVVSIAVIILVCIGIIAFCRPPTLAEIQEEESNNLVQNEEPPVLDNFANQN